jgi:hypothetical protein
MAKVIIAFCPFRFITNANTPRLLCVARFAGDSMFAPVRKAAEAPASKIKAPRERLDAPGSTFMMLHTSSTRGEISG